MFKKILLCFLFLSYGFLYADIKRTGRVVIYSPETEGLGKEESLYICSSIQDNFEANFSQYTDFQLVDIKNQKKIVELQKKSEMDPFFDEKTAIEVGKLVFAEYALFSKIKRNGSSFFLTSDFTNLTTGEKFTVVSSNFPDLSDLSNRPGCAVNEISLKLFDLLNLDIPNSQRYELMKNISFLDSSEQQKQAQDNIDFYQKRIDKIERDIQLLKTSKDENKEEEQIRLEAIKKLNQEKLLSNKRVLERIKEEEIRKIEEERKDLLRSEKQKKQRQELLKKIENQEKVLKEMKHDYFLPSQEIDIIEEKKKILFEIRKSVDESITSVRKIYFDDYERKIEELQSKPYRSIELINGIPSEEAKENRKRKEAELLDDFNRNIAEEEAKLKDSVKKQELYLVEEIRKDYETLSKERSVNTMSPLFKSVFSSYNPEKKGWNVLLLFEDNYISFVDQIWLAYSDVSSLVSDSNNSDLYEAYLDKVEILDSCFKRGDTLLFFDMRYIVTPMPDIYPSQYQVKIGEVTIRDVINQNIVKVRRDFTNITKIERKPSYKIEGLQAESVANQIISKPKVVNSETKIKKQSDPVKTKSKPSLLWSNFEDNRKNFPNSILLDSFSYGISGNNTFLKNNIELLSIPLKYLRLNTFQLGFGKDGYYSFDSYGTGIEAWLPFTENFCAYVSGDWAIGEYKYSQGYKAFSFTSGLYTVGVRFAYGDFVQWIVNIGYGVQLSDNISDNYKLPNKKLINVGIGFGIDFS